jgi:hydrogenase maturation protein HypF
MDNTNDPSATEARHIVLGGRVQGVGFRPFVFRLAHAHGVAGWVKNLTGQVEIFAQSRVDALDRFAHALVDAAPPLSRPEILSARVAPLADVSGFTILASESVERPEIHVPPDYFACDDCVRELNDPTDRRYRYPFINCTQCGPRYTLIGKLPYDRPNTTMSGFALCPACRAEYDNPLDRRFHAEPVACAACGPQLEWRNWTRGNGVKGDGALAACVHALRTGRIVAVKGIGGYHLMCDARSDEAVADLRGRKPRPHKPLAVMFPVRGAESANGPSLARGPRLDPIADGLDAVRAEAVLTPVHEALLRDPMRPIVLVPKRPDATLSKEIAPGLSEIGVFLPYSPLHHLLLDAFDAPLVATSANVSGEPVLTDNRDVETRLAHVAHAFLHHNRPIARPADDPVFRVIAGAPRPLRLGRGVAPLEVDLPVHVPQPLLAVGGHMKNTIALAWGARAVVSPHIGDLDAPRSLAVFEQVIDDLQTLYGVRAARIVHDAHPGYASTRYARRAGLPAAAVFHHHAHASALAGEYPQVARWLVFTWDGVGYGEDGTLWGGEALLGSPGQWRRVASMRPFHLPGGERAGREPWRSALALCWEAGIDWRARPTDVELLRQAWDKRINTPQSSAVGRLFDAAAALTGLNLRSSFEGQGPMLLEAACRDDGEIVKLPLAPDPHGVWRSDWAPLLTDLIDARRPVSERAAMFHASLAQALLDQARCLRDAHGAFTVGLSGGVFQNRILAERVVGLLRSHSFDVRFGEQIPCNDAGISFGQLIESGWRR